jgi:CheY-like chemotaxis protein
MSRHYLVVDDNLEFAENVAEIIRETGAVVDVVGDGRAALERVVRTRYDAVVTDMRMPGLTGAELVHEVRAVDPGVPIILVSAYSADAQLQAAKYDGVLAVLSKPSQVPRLLELLTVARRDGMVALVEDDPGLVENLEDLLASRGMTVCSAATVSDVDHLAVRPFLALVDLKVPGGEAGAALERVRTRFPETPRLVISAYADELKCAEECVRKPFDSRQLLRRIESLYEARHPA